MSDLIPVEGVPCPCPGHPHPEGDTVSLRAVLGLHAGVVAQRKIISALEGKADNDEVVATLMDAFLQQGVAEWTLIDEKAKPIPVTPESIQTYLLSNFAVGMAVAEKADSLYSPALIDPLRNGSGKSSPVTPINGSTSPKTGSSRKPRKR